MTTILCPQWFRFLIYRPVLLGLLLVVSFGLAELQQAWADTDTDAKNYDVVVYGGTSSGVIAAVQAKRMGKSVILVWPSYAEDLRLARVTPATLSSEFPVTHEVIEGFRAMSGGSIAAVGLALQYGVGFHIGGGFHHAFPDHAEGFCYLHDMAIAVERFRAQAGLGKVLFVDVDLHQGNGTAVIYRGDESTYTYSIHQEHNYPLKQRSDLDRGLDDGVGDDQYLDYLQSDLDAIDRCFKPQLVCHVAGVDPFHADQLGGLALSEEGLRRRDQLVLGRFIGRGVPVAVFLAGGYARTPEQTARLHLGTAMAARGPRRRRRRRRGPRLG